MLSVIVPVYGAEKYIEKCARSLFGQTLKDIEYIFIDDCTPDQSIDILNATLDDYPERKSQVHIYRNPKNQGAAASRANGMKLMTGDYMIHCDPDDWLELDMYEKMYLLAKDNDADVVSCRMRSEYITDDGNRSHLSGECFTGSGHQALKRLRYSLSLCDKMIRSTIIKDNEIYPIAGYNYGEDMNIVVRTYIHATKIIGLDEALYHYLRNNLNSCTNQGFVKNLTTSVMPQMEIIEKYYRDHTDGSFDEALDHLKFTLKEKLISKPRDLKTWSRIWPECHKSIRTLPIGYNKKFLTVLSSLADHPTLLGLFYKIYDRLGR